MTFNLLALGVVRNRLRGTCGYYEDRLTALQVRYAYSLSGLNDLCNTNQSNQLKKWPFMGRPQRSMSGQRVLFG